jgi:DNA repair protein RecO (recombination protein O)
MPRPALMATARRPVAPLDAFVLHRYDWSETSLILDLFTRSRGRIAVAAKGAKRPYSQLRSVLLLFQRITATVGRQAEEAQAEVLTLRGAEWAGVDACAVLPAARLFAGFYLNELLMKLLARGDAHPALFDAYAATLGVLAALAGAGPAGHGADAGGHGNRDGNGDGDGASGPRAAGADDLGEQIALRAFELVLLREIGLLPELDRVTATQAPLDPEASYELLGDRGVVAADPARPGARLAGADLVALDGALRANALGPLHAACAPRLDRLRPVLRALVHYHLGSPALRTRDVMRDARQLMEPR